VHTLKAYAAMEVSGQLHLPATLPPVKYHLISTEQEAGRVIEPVHTLWRKMSFPSHKLKYNSSVLQPIA